ncbi:MAG TPA: DUF6249 domain-containing protein [bacterium]
MANMTPVFVLAVIFLGLIGIMKVMSDNRLRHKLIDKGLLDENVKYLYKRENGASAYSNFKWGLICVAVGLAFSISWILPHRWSMSHEGVTVALLFLFVGLALLIYHARISKLEPKSDPQTATKRK